MEDDKYIYGELVCVDTPLASGRVYTREVLEKAVKDSEATVDKGQFPVYEGERKLSNMVGVVESLRLEKDAVEVRIKLLDVPRSGTILRLFEQGVVNFRPSGVGSVKDNVVQEDYLMDSINLVVDD